MFCLEISSHSHAESLVPISQAFWIENLWKDLFISRQFKEEKDYVCVYPSNKKYLVPFFLKANIKLFLEGRSKASPGCLAFEVSTLYPIF